jgi:hypothetical protein
MKRTMSKTEYLRLTEKVMRSDRSYSLRDVEQVAMEEFGLSAVAARQVVRAWDRRLCITSADLEKLWNLAIANDDAPELH